MKIRFLATFFLACAAITSFAQNSKSTSANTVKVKADSMTLRNETGSFGFYYEEPKNEASPLHESVMDCFIGLISENEYGAQGYKGDRKDIYSIMNFNLAQWDKTAKEDFSVGGGYFSKHERYLRFTKGSEGSNWVNYHLYYYHFCAGAHPYDDTYGITFNKTTGKQLSWDDFNTNLMKSATFQALIKANLRKHFGVKTNKALERELQVDDFNHIPLPEKAPCFTKKGVKLVYQEGEISYIAAGAFQFIIPYSTMQKYMKEGAKALLK